MPADLHVSMEPAVFISVGIVHITYYSRGLIRQIGEVPLVLVEIAHHVTALRNGYARSINSKEGWVKDGYHEV